MWTIEVKLGYVYDPTKPTDFAPPQKVINALHALGIPVAVQLEETTDTNQTLPPPPNNVVKRPVGRPAKAPKATAPVEELNTTSPFEDQDPDTAEDPDASLSPHDALEKGLGILRNLYNAGHKDQVRQIQRDLGVLKFNEVPDQRGHDLYKAAVTVAESVGMRP